MKVFQQRAYEGTSYDLIDCLFMVPFWSGALQRADLSLENMICSLLLSFTISNRQIFNFSKYNRVLAQVAPTLVIRSIEKAVYNLTRTPYDYTFCLSSSTKSFSFCVRASIKSSHLVNEMQSVFPSTFY